MTDLTGRIQYFLGANSAEGFFSLYPQWVDQKKIQAFYCIKGGAGCGKSTLMAKVAQQMEEERLTVEYIRCSGDPDSLDGILIPQKGAALLDGTAPHTMDPAFPGATGHYLDLGQGYDRKALFALRKELIAATQAYQSWYPKAYRCIRGAEESLRRGRRTLHTRETLAKTEKRAALLLEKEGGSGQAGPGERTRRFLSGVTGQGQLFLEDTVFALCDRCYVLRDDCGLAGILLTHLEKGFLEKGFDVILCLDPVSPGWPAHLLVPGCGLAFVTQSLKKKTGKSIKTIRTESLVEKGALQEGRSFLRLSQRVAEELMKEAFEHLAQAKQAHDQLEVLYHPHVDFSLAQTLAQRTAEEILALPDIPH